MTSAGIETGTARRPKSASAGGRRGRPRTRRRIDLLPGVTPVLGSLGLAQRRQTASPLWQNPQGGRRKLARALRDVRQGLPFPGQRLTTGQFLSEWLQDTRHKSGIGRAKAPHARMRRNWLGQDERTPVAGGRLCGSTSDRRGGLQGIEHPASALRGGSRAYVWAIGGSLRWDPLRGDPTSVANRLVQGEWYSRDADVYRASAERYLLWVLQALDLAAVERTPKMVLRHLDHQVLLKLLRGLGRVPDAERLAVQVSRLGTTEHEGIAGFRARFGLVLEGVAAKSLGSGLALEDAVRARRPVLFSLDAATYPDLATKLGAWVLLDLGTVSALRPGPSLVVVDEFSAAAALSKQVPGRPTLERTPYAAS